MFMFFVFFLFFSAVYFFIHFYLYTKILQILPAFTFVKVVFLLGAFSFLLGEFLIRKFSSFFARVVYFTGAVWIGAVSIALVFFLLADFSGIFFKGKFSFYANLSAACLSFVFLVWSLINGARFPVFREVAVHFENLPSELENFRIVHLADLHLNAAKSSRRLKKIVEKINSLDPDIVCITGDLIDADVSKTPAFAEILGGISSRFGVFAVGGNHEVYAGWHIFEELASKAGIKILNDEKVEISPFLEIAGISWESQNLKFLEGNDEKFVLFLSHNPDVFKKTNRDVSLQLSGHTHAGQVLLFEMIIPFVFKYPWGLYREGNAFVYTTSGAGNWSSPMRTFSRTEVPVITLHRL